MYYESTQYITTFLYIFKIRVCSLPSMCSTHLKNSGTYKCVEMNNSWSWVWDWTFCQRSQVQSKSLTPMWTPETPPQPQLSSHSITPICSSHRGVKYSLPLFIIIIIIIVIVTVILIIIITTILILSGVMKSVYRCRKN